MTNEQLTDELMTVLLLADRVIIVGLLTVVLLTDRVIIVGLLTCRVFIVGLVTSYDSS